MKIRQLRKAVQARIGHPSRFQPSRVTTKVDTEGGKVVLVKSIVMYGRLAGLGVLRRRVGFSRPVTVLPGEDFELDGSGNPTSVMVLEDEVLDLKIFQDVPASSSLYELLKDEWAYNDPPGSEPVFVPQNILFGADFDPYLRWRKS